MDSGGDDDNNDDNVVSRRGTIIARRSVLMKAEVEREDIVVVQEGFGGDGCKARMGSMQTALRFYDNAQFG